MIAFSGSINAEVEHGADLDRNIVAGNHVLRRHFVDHHAQIDAHHLLDERHQDEQTGTFRSGKRPSVKTTPRSYSRSTRTGGIQKQAGPERR